VFRRSRGTGFALEEVARGYDLDDVREATGMRYEVAPDVRLDAYGPPEEAQVPENG